ASIGSNSCVAWLIRTSFACVSVDTSTVLVSRAANRLKLLGSLRTEMTIEPPRAGADGVAADWDERDPQPAAIGASTARMLKNRTIRTCPVKSCPVGQKTVRPKKGQSGAQTFILRAERRQPAPECADMARFLAVGPVEIASVARFIVVH